MSRSVYLGAFDHGASYAIGGPGGHGTTNVILTLLQAGASKVIMPGVDPGTVTALPYLRSRILSTGFDDAFQGWMEFVSRSKVRDDAVSQHRDFARATYFLADVIYASTARVSLATVAPLPGPQNTSADSSDVIPTLATNLVLAMQETELSSVVPVGAIRDVDVQLVSAVLEGPVFAHYSTSHDLLQSGSLSVEAATQRIGKAADAVANETHGVLSVKKAPLFFLNAFPQVLSLKVGKVAELVSKPITSALAKLLVDRRRLLIYRVDQHPMFVVTDTSQSSHY
jgi:hypothetical protein